MFQKHPYPGIYIAFEGGEGAGKSVQIHWLWKQLQELCPDRRVVKVFEPGGTKAGNLIRELVQHHKDVKICPVTECYLYAAARAELIAEVITPALTEGDLVIADRSFFTSMAYQGYGRELGFDFVWEVNEPAVGKIIPDRVLLLDVDLVVGFDRKRNDGLLLDRIETANLVFHQKAREGYLALVEMFPKIFIKIDGNGSIEQVREVVLEQTLRCIEGKRVEGAIRRERE